MRFDVFECINRLTVAGVICAVFFLALHRPASAMAEVCPTTLHYRLVPQPLPSATFGFELRADGLRTVTAAQALLDTTGGWFTVNLPAGALHPSTRSYDTPIGTVRHSDWVSAPVWVSFPSAVIVQHAWVAQAALAADAMGWKKNVLVNCPPPATLDATTVSAFISGDPSFFQASADHPYYTNDETQRLDSPPAGAVPIVAQPIRPRLSTACDRPFMGANARHHDGARFEIPPVTFGGQAIIEVALDERGNVKDSSIWQSSGSGIFDDAALQNLKTNNFIAGRAYCQDVPGIYFYVMTVKRG